MITIGLTGSVGMGKSVAAQYFRGMGVPVHDSDAVVHDLYVGAAAERIGAAFPEVMRAGKVDRRLLGNRVFADPREMRRLEKVVHPLVAADRQEFLRRHEQLGTKLVVLDIPLLFEAGYDQDVDVIVVVDAPISVQKSRVMSRPGMTSERLESILARQIPSVEKRKRAHFVIDSSRGFPSAENQIRALLRTLTGKANG